jgi:hypothetical protein
MRTRPRAQCVSCAPLLQALPRAHLVGVVALERDNDDLGPHALLLLLLPPPLLLLLLLLLLLCLLLLLLLCLLAC